jgi:hypothetical protein
MYCSFSDKGSPEQSQQQQPEESTGDAVPKSYRSFRRPAAGMKSFIIPIRHLLFDSAAQSDLLIFIFCTGM